jgi:phage recombination protein Bet
MSTSKELQIRQVTEEDMDTLAKAGIIPANTPVSQLKVFARKCAEHGLSPFKGEIHLVKYKTKHDGDKYTTIVGIDGFRSKAARTKELAGAEMPRYNVRGDGSFETAAELIQAERLPDTCTMTVYRIKDGIRVAFTAEAVFKEFAKVYNGELQDKWKTMPFQMIAKVAEAFALRKGFADEVAGLSIEEESAAYEGTNTGDIDQEETRKTAIENLTARITHVKTGEVLWELWSEYKDYHKDEEVIEIFRTKNRELKDQQVEPAQIVE